jgi:hypothetical protein
MALVAAAADVRRQIGDPTRTLNFATANSQTFHAEPFCPFCSAFIILNLAFPDPPPGKKPGKTGQNRAKPDQRLLRTDLVRLGDLF